MTKKTKIKEFCEKIKEFFGNDIDTDKETVGIWFGDDDSSKMIEFADYYKDEKNHHNLGQFGVNMYSSFYLAIEEKKKIEEDQGSVTSKFSHREYIKFKDPSEIKIRNH